MDMDLELVMKLVLVIALLGLLAILWYFDLV